MAEQLTCEIAQSMAGILLQPCPPPKAGIEQQKMEAIHGTIGSDNEMQVQLRAESGLFTRLTRNMIGKDPKNAEEVREYAVEFFNVLCGRFVSELHEMIHAPIQLFSIEYELLPEGNSLGKEGTVTTLWFISEEEEIAAFSWTAMLIEKMLRRNTNVNA